MKNERNGVRTWIEIDSAAIKHNMGVFRSSISQKTKLMAVVKSNAYGHGLLDFSREVSRLGADWLGVDSLIEGLALRKNGNKIPILVLGYTLPERLSEAAENNISITISSMDNLEALLGSLAPKSLKIHVKVDTGMHRQGFLVDQLEEFCEKIIKANKRGARIVIEGLYTHFAAAKNPSFPQETTQQIELFERAIKVVGRFGFYPIKHAAATAGTLLFPKTHYDMVRIGIGLYGLWPSKETMRALENKIELTPVLSWKTIVGEVKTLPEGGGVGYDLTERMQPKSKIVICPIGYWHGFGRALSSIGNVLIHGKRARVIGRVSMDMITVDISKIASVKVGDEVVIIGTQNREQVTADELAYLSDTTNYEIVTRTNPLIKRIVV